MTKDARYKISLRITHPSMQSDEISRDLKLEPMIFYSAGDMRKTPKGHELPGRRSQSFWCYDLPETNGSFEDALSIFNKLLVEKKEFLKRIIETGGQLEYFVGWFSEGNSGFILEPEFLSQLAELKIRLAFDIYSK